MPVQRKVFRIEQGTRSDWRGELSARDAEAALRHHEFMAEIKALRRLLEPRAGTSRDAMEMARAQVAEAQAYKAELETIHAALQRSQRVGTVVETLAFLEEHVERLMEIWHHVEQLKPVVFDEPTDVDKKLLNGPKLAGDAGNSSQNDIVSLFDS